MPDAKPPSDNAKSTYLGPKDLGRAESLYRSARTKPDIDYATQLLFAALVANPEHEQAFAAILAKIPIYAANKRRMVVRGSDLLGGTPADAFIKSLAAYCASPRVDEAIACAAEAQRVALNPYCVTLAATVLQRLETGDTSIKSAAVARVIDLFEAAGSLDHAVRAAKSAARLFPDEAAFREREKNLLASQYMSQTQLSDQTPSRDMLRHREQQEALHRPPGDPSARIDELEQRFQASHQLEDFRELVRALRESTAARRETALPTLEDGLQRFGDRETRWFVREIKLERDAAELRVHRRLLDERPSDAVLAAEHEKLRRRVLGEQIDHLYEVVSALPSGAPERGKRQLELARKLFDATRFEEAIKQAQSAKRRPEIKLDAWVIMAKSFVQLGLTPEATECFQSIIGELNSAPQGGTEKVLEAKYAYAQFLADEAERANDSVLARQARKLCSDVMVEDIDYRGVRPLAARLDAIISHT